MKENEHNDKFMRLLKPCYKNLEKYALSLTRNREDAQDIVGETLLRAFEKFSSLRDEKAFLSFLFTIASRIHYGNIKKQKRLSYSAPEEFDKLFGKGQSPEYYTDGKILYEALDELPGRQREAILLYDIFGLSYKEVCTVQKSNMAVVKMRIFRGRKKLAAILTKQNYTEIHEPKEIEVNKMFPVYEREN